MVKKKKRNPVICDMFEDTQRQIIVVDVHFGLVLFDNFEDPVYSDWENKTIEEQTEIINSRKPKTYYDAYGKMSEEQYREVYKLTPDEPSSIGVVRTVVLRHKKRKDIVIQDDNKDPNNTIQ